MCIESVKKKTNAQDFHEIKLKFKDFRMLRFSFQGKEIDKALSYIQQVSRYFTLIFRNTAVGWLIVNCLSNLLC